MPLTCDVEAPHSHAVVSLTAAARDELDRRYGPDDTDKADLHLDEMTPPQGAFVVARLDGHLAGGVGLRSIGLPEHHYGEIKRLWVRPDLRRSGVAKALMDHVEDVARSLGMIELYLETGWLQPEAHAFYEKTGWRSVSEFPDGAWSYPKGIKFAKVL